MCSDLHFVLGDLGLPRLVKKVLKNNEKFCEISWVKAFLSNRKEPGSDATWLLTNLWFPTLPKDSQWYAGSNSTNSMINTWWVTSGESSLRTLKDFLQCVYSRVHYSARYFSPEILNLNTPMNWRFSFLYYLLSLTRPGTHEKSC